MPLVPGTRLGPYEILDALGAGGMGEVYRARDTRLQRSVAIKVLPEAFATDPDRLARFEREAQVLASLNHPNIAQIHGLEDSTGTPALVMELVEGDDLGQRLDRGPLSLEEALPVARQIAEALEAAHEHGIVHRDLKPANVKLRRDGTVKVLDFGLAKALEPPASPGATGAEAPTLMSPAGWPHARAATAFGMILGTAAYMAPEQARGGTLDKRVDIWAFGCVLYEMLAGCRTFDSPTVSDAIAAILTRDPDWNRLPAATPQSVRRLLARCLERDPRRRLRDIGEARIVLDGAFEADAAATGAPTPRTAGWRRALPWSITALVAVAAGIAVWAAWQGPTTETRQVVRFTLPLSDAQRLAFGEVGDSPALTLSPDGRRLVYVARDARGAQLYVRDLDRVEPRVVPGTENARGPFFSPDGEWVGFFTDIELKKVPLKGGGPQVICGVSPVTRGASWGPGEMIVFAPHQASGLVSVSASRRVDASDGATRTPPALSGLPAVTSLQGGERAHLWPQILPGGRAVLFTIATSGNVDDSIVAVQSLDDGSRRILIRGGTSARYLPSGHIVYARAGALLRLPFDLVRLEVTGPPVTVLEGVRLDARSGATHFSVSGDGSIAYVPGGLTSTDRTLVWVDRRGTVTPATATRRPYSYVTLSPDGHRAALTIQGANQDIWIHDLERDTQTRLTFGPWENWGQTWTPEGRRLIFSTHGPHLPTLFWTAADGSGKPEALTASKPDAAQFAGDLSPDGKLLIYTEHMEATGDDLWLLPLEEPAAARRYLGTRFDEYGPRFSPDGRWLAYVSTESGRPEVYVQPFPGPGAKRQVSATGGVAPLWARRSPELFYRNGDRMLVVGYSADAEFVATAPKVVFEGRFEEHGVSHWARNYDVTPEGDRFLMVKASDEPPSRRIEVVLGWLSELSADRASVDRSVR